MFTNGQGERQVSAANQPHRTHGQYVTSYSPFYLYYHLMMNMFNGNLVIIYRRPCYTYVHTYIRVFLYSAYIFNEPRAILA